MKRLTLIFTCFLLSMGIAIGQNVLVSGTVLDEGGEPVIGASIEVKDNPQIGTITDLNGKFSLEVPTSASTLVVGSVGMTRQEVAVAPIVTVTLSVSDALLDEVMVVAYGTAKRSSFTGSAAVVTTEKIEKRQVSNITNALAGQVAGVQVTSSNGQPGLSSTIRIRGIGSMAAGNTPLYVVDGVPYDGDISAINTADIESTTILKDAASNALYGARGANGVVLITTKKGRTYEPIVSVDARWGTNRRAVPNYDVMTDPGMYMEKAYEAIYNSFIYQGRLSPEEANQKANAALSTNSDGGVGYKIYTVPDGQLLIGLDGKLNSNATLGYSTDTYTIMPDNWYDELFDTNNLRQEYNVSVSGASEKLTYFFSGGYLDDSGITENSGFTRYSTRLNTDYQVKKWLKIGANMAYTHYDMQYPAEQEVSLGSGNLFYLANFIAPIYPLYMRDGQGNIKVDGRGFTQYDFGDNTNETDFSRTFMSGSNPAAMAQLDKREYLSDVFGGRWFAAIDLYDGLKFTYNFGVDVDNTTYRRLYNAYYGQYSQVGGIVYAGSTRTFSINHQQLLTYQKKFGVHNIEVLLGHESYDYQYKYLRGSKEKLYNPQVVEIDNAIVSPSVYSYTNNYSTEGWLGRVQYEYDGKYILSGSYRRDATSRFHPDNRWGNFGSVGLAWVMSNESFLETQSWIDFLKFKASYGIQGNDLLLYQDGTVNYHPYQDQYTLSNNNGEFATALSYKGNEDITWEKSQSFNTGFDFTFFGGKLAGGIEYYNRLTKDQLYYKPVPLTGGFGYLPMNIGSMSNSGFEFDLHSVVFSNKDVNITIFANLTTWKNTIKELAPELEGELIDGSYILREGDSRYQMYLRKYAGVNETGEALFYMDVLDDDGNVVEEMGETTTLWNQATRYAMGNMLPKVYGGFGFSVNAYGFDLSASAAYQLGGKVYDNSYASLMFGGLTNSAGQNWHKDILNSWSSTNTNTNIPRVNSLDTYANYTSDRFLASSDYLDITNVTLGYTLPKSLTQKVEINHVRIYVAGDNLKLFSTRKGFDPRHSFTTSSSNRYSPIRSISGGISIKF